MKKILNVESPREHYLAGATVVWCFDARFADALEKFKQMTPNVKVDAITTAGGVKRLASPDSTSDRETLLIDIGKSVDLHKSETIVIMAHDQCGAYGGRQDDLDFYLDELKKGEKLIKEHFPGKKVMKVFVAFDGIYQV